MSDQTPTPDQRGGIGHGSSRLKFDRFKALPFVHEAVLVTRDNVIEVVANSDKRVAFPSEIGGRINDDVVVIKTPIRRVNATIPFYLCRNSRGDLYPRDRESHEATFARIANNHNTDRKQQISRPSRNVNTVLSAISFFIPIIGIVVGLTMLCRDDERGGHYLAMGCIIPAIFLAIYMSIVVV